MNKNNGLLIDILLASSVLTACVTINIYFPAAAADKVADKIIDDVWQLKKDGKAGDAKASETKPNETKTGEPAKAPALETK